MGVLYTHTAATQRCTTKGTKMYNAQKLQNLMQACINARGTRKYAAACKRYNVYYNKCFAN